MSYKISFKDLVTKIKLDIQNNFRYFFGIKKEGDFTIPKEYNLVFYDTFGVDFNLKWESGDTWWGAPYHPNNLNIWYDQEQIKQTSEGVSFSAILKPKYFLEIDKTIPNAIGLMRSRNNSWKYGIFTFTAKLPAGTYLWPALWLSGFKNWPPEIDLLEGYSDSTIDYHHNKKLNSNFHMKEGTDGNYDSGTKSHKLPVETTKDFVTYIIWWEKDFIKLYYNNYLVRHITDKEILDGMFESQNIIIGTGTQNGFNKNNISPLIVSRVAVYQK